MFPQHSGPGTSVTETEWGSSPLRSAFRGAIIIAEVPMTRRIVGCYVLGLVHPGRCTTNLDEVTKDVLDLVNVLDSGRSLQFGRA